MSEVRPEPISYRAAELVLSIMEMPSMGISATALDEYHSEAGAELLALGALEPDGFEPVVVSQADHDDAITTAAWDADIGGYATFSPTAGWVTVPDERLKRFRVDFTVVIARLMQQVDWPSRAGAVPLVPDLLWEIGDVRLGRRTQRVPIWFARQLHDTAVWRQVGSAAQSRPAARLRVLLTSTPAHRLPTETLPGHVVVDVRDVIDHSEGLSVHPDILASRLDGSHRPNVEAAIDLSPDGTRLTINGNVRIDFKSNIQIAIIRKLVAGHKEGRRFTARELLDHANSGAKALHQAFGAERWAKMQPYLKTENGLWGFEL